MDNGIKLVPVAKIYTDFSEKFGIPRQSGLVAELGGKIVLEPEYRRAEALRGLEGFTHIWLIWQFSECAGAPWSPTVRPPRLGGNTRVGVFASRSPFRPNSLALSCVKLDRIDYDCDDAPVIYVSGIDMLSGTPVYDIKPYVPVADCRTDAVGGYTEKTREHRVAVEIPDEESKKIPPDKRAALVGILENDPRPGYDADEKEYGICFAGYNIRFCYEKDRLRVTRITELPPD